jgi:N-methylhydantoinase A
MLRLSNAAMLNAIRLMTTQRGHDPRRFSLIGFGGAGALHVADLAREIGISRVVIPRLPGLMSARGILYIDVRHDMLEPLFQRASSLDTGAIQAALDRSLEQCEQLKARETTVKEWHVEHHADVRYFGQISGYLTKALPGGDPVAALRQVAQEFGDEHEREFGYRLPSEVAEIEIVNLSTTLVGRVDEVPEPAYAPTAQASDPVSGEVYFLSEGGRLTTPYVERDSLAPGDELEGPAVITEWDSTTIVPPRSTAEVAETGDLVMTLEPQA